MVDDPSGQGRAEPRHVLAALERLNVRLGEEMGARLGAAGIRLRGSQGRILQLLGAGGARPTDLAAGSWITKQAIGKRIRDLEERGLVRTLPDPADGRAVLVQLTPEGERVRHITLGCVSDLERDLAEEVGVERYEVFRAVLDAIGRDPGPAR